MPAPRAVLAKIHFDYLKNKNLSASNLKSEVSAVHVVENKHEDVVVAEVAEVVPVQHEVEVQPLESVETNEAQNEEALMSELPSEEEEKQNTPELDLLKRKRKR